MGLTLELKRACWRRFETPTMAIQKTLGRRRRGRPLSRTAKRCCVGDAKGEGKPRAPRVDRWVWKHRSIRARRHVVDARRILGRRRPVLPSCAAGFPQPRIPHLVDQALLSLEGGGGGAGEGERRVIPLRSIIRPETEHLLTDDSPRLGSKDRHPLLHTFAVFASS